MNLSHAKRQCQYEVIAGRFLNDLTGMMRNLDFLMRINYYKYKMLIEYIQAALERAKYEIIRDEEPYYGEIPELKGVWATGKTLEECRKKLADVIEGWIIVRIRKGLPIPPIGSYNIEEIKEIKVIG